MEKPEAKEILTRYLAGACTEEETALVESWHLSYELDGVKDLEFDKQVKDLDKVWAALQQSEPALKIVKLWPKVAVAAAVILIAGLGLFFYAQKATVEREQIKLASEILPGKNDAVLTLSNGKKILLNATSSGEIARQSGISISKAADGTIVYTSNGSADGILPQAGKLEYNTISTPRGGQYQLNLPDGTKVWLNAASELKYPVLFAANERRVELHGEAYFEVYKNKISPFHVRTASQDLEVLGTHFNVNAFTDEPETNTTLLEGSVRIVPFNVQHIPGMKSSVVLKPGEQAVLDSKAIKVQVADGEEAISWKNGMFHFSETELSSIMRQAARWYDVDVRYEGKIPAVKFSGEVPRNVNAAAFLDMLKYLDVKFNIENGIGNRKRIVVSQ